MTARDVSSRFAARLRRSAHTPAAISVASWAGTFALLLAILFFQGANAIHGVVTMGLNADRIIDIYGSADAGSYALAGVDLIKHGGLTSDTQWVVNLWPPGMVWLDALVIKFSPLPFVASIAVVTALVISLPIAVISRHFMVSWRKAAIVYAIQLVVFASVPFQSWMLDEGLLYADGIAAAFFLLGVALIVSRTIRGGDALLWTRDGIFAGIAFAGMMYFRSSYQLVPYVLVGLGAVLGVALVVRKARRRELGSLPRTVALLIAAVLSFGVLLQPYTSYVYQSRGTLQLVQTQNLVYEHVWQDPAREDVPGFMRWAGSTLGCDIDKVRCDDVYAAEAAGAPLSSDELRDDLVAAILQHPGDFVVNRVTVVWKQWFGDEIDSYSYSNVDYSRGDVSYGESGNPNVPSGLIYLALLIASSAAAIVLARRGHPVALIVPLLALSILAPFSIVHVEVRYLIPLKVLGLVLPLLLVLLATVPARRRQQQSEDVVS